MDKSDILLNLVDVEFRYKDEIVYLQLNLQVLRDKITVIMGPSGCGKSTLLGLMTAQLEPVEGTVLFEGTSLAGLSRRDLYAIRRRTGMMFQNNALFSDLNVFENVAFPVRENSKMPDALIRNLVLIKLQMVGLRGAAHFMPEMLSGGMARRVALARSLALDPDLAFYDEPFTGLDPISKGIIARLIKDTNTVSGSTSVVITQDVNEGLAIADQVIILSKGQVVASGAPYDIVKSNNSEVRQFLNAEPDGPLPFHYPAPDYEGQLIGTHR
tara:strand:+ start:9587 stop:10396 length:810 start_codon:yes stop_codon:yes gene_type:complete